MVYILHTVCMFCTRDNFHHDIVKSGGSNLYLLLLLITNQGYEENMELMVVSILLQI